MALLADVLNAEDGIRMIRSFDSRVLSLLIPKNSHEKRHPTKGNKKRLRERNAKAQTPSSSTTYSVFE